jgi:hypothetical protein
MDEGKRRDRLPSTSVDGGVKDDVNGGDLFFFFGCIFCLVLESEKREPTKKSPSDERNAGPTVSHGSVSKKWFDGMSRFHFEFFFAGARIRIGNLWKIREKSWGESHFIGIRIHCEIGRRIRTLALSPSCSTYFLSKCHKLSTPTR